MTTKRRAKRSKLHSCILGAPPCPVCRAQAVEDMLESGRPDMALQMVRGPADDIVEHGGQAMWRERCRGLEIGAARVGKRPAPIAPENVA